MGRRAHKPDPSLRRQVEALAAYGIPETDIGRVVGIDPKTLRKHYREELDLGEAKANAQVAGYLFNAAKNGNVTAQIFWLKTRAKWRETPVELKHSGSIARKDLSRKDLSEVSDEASAEIITWAASEQLRQCLEHLNRTGKSTLEVLLAPQQPVGNSISFCPRCGCQFVISSGACPDCPGVGLLAFPEREAEVERAV